MTEHEAIAKLDEIERKLVQPEHRENASLWQARLVLLRKLDAARKPKEPKR